MFFVFFTSKVTGGKNHFSLNSNIPHTKTKRYVWFLSGLITLKATQKILLENKVKIVNYQKMYLLGKDINADRKHGSNLIRTLIFRL